MEPAAIGSLGDPSNEPRRSRRRTTTVLVTAAAAVAALAVGAGVVHAATKGAPDPATMRLAGGSARDVVLDQGPTSNLAGCVDDAFATDPSTVEVLYGMRQTSPTGATPVLVVRNATGQVRLCDMFGHDAPSVIPMTLPTVDTPVSQLSNGRRDWTCRARTLQQFRTSQWLSVLSTVAAVRLRFVVDGTPRPWFVTRPVDGIAHLQAWLDGPLPRHATVALEEQVLDAAGRPVAQDAVPTGRQPLTGCGSGSAMIG